MPPQHDIAVKMGYIPITIENITKIGTGFQKYLNIHKCIYATVEKKVKNIMSTNK